MAVMFGRIARCTGPAFKDLSNDDRFKALDLRDDSSSDSMTVTFGNDALQDYFRSDFKNLVQPFSIGIHKSQGSECRTAIISITYGSLLSFQSMTALRRSLMSFNSGSAISRPRKAASAASWRSRTSYKRMTLLSMGACSST